MIHRTVKRIAHLQQLFNTALGLSLPLVSYRLPGAEAPESVLQLEAGEQPWTAASRQGFVVAPFAFDGSTGHPAHWVQADLRFRGFSFDPQQAQSVGLSAAQLVAMSAFYAQLGQSEAVLWPSTARGEAVAISQNEYEQQVRDVLSALAQGELEKIVLSRVKIEALAADLHPAMLFERLCAAYPQAFVSLVSLPGWGCWLGASPELLLAQEADGFKTMSLAGTRLAGAAGDWGAKEQHEQQLVTDYICAQLEAAGLEVEVGARETVEAGQVQHLRNLIAARGEASSFDLATALHPTPAVCGLPVAAARQYLAEHEAHDRRLYGGFLGPVDGSGQATFYVNLRSMELQAGRATLYLGGGIVAGSEPEAEWQETEHKAATLLRILQA